jgi:hypothetical protein
VVFHAPVGLEPENKGPNPRGFFANQCSQRVEPTSQKATDILKSILSVVLTCWMVGYGAAGGVSTADRMH